MVMSVVVEVISYECCGRRDLVEVQGEDVVLLPLLAFSVTLLLAHRKEHFNRIKMKSQVK